MANLYPIFIGFFIFVSAWSSGSTADDGLSLAQLQEQLQQLKTNYEILEEKFLRLELAQLATGERQTNQAQTKNAIFRTCSEARTVDPSLASGMYWIDPDGEGVGDDPIYVSCDMATGKTSVLHDSESPTDVGHCPDPGCYSREIIYSATMRQITTLVELSDECHQSIKYDCNYAPFETNGVTYSWWDDRNGNPQYFWAGSNSSVHTCQCGIDGNCIDSIVKCNCDATVPLLLSDSGVITKETLLPITKLNFGRTQLSSSSGSHTLGRFECSGGTTVTGMPTSCEDLWRIGHSMSGLYSVMGTKMVETVYCDFTKSLSDPAFQTWIGFDGVQSASVYFYVQRNGDFRSTNNPITFDVVRTNTGGAMNAGNGKFTAPVTGTYFFSFSGIAYMIGTTSDGDFQASLRRNGEQIGRVETKMTQGLSTDGYSLQSTLYLQSGEQIWMQSDRESNMYLHDDGNHYTHFTGWLLQEDVAQSFKNRL